MHGIDRAVRSNVFLTALIWASFFALPASAEMFGSDHPACGHQPNTVAIVDCLNTKTGVWDRRLNSAFQGLKQRISPDQTDALQTAQRLWMQYRDANCRFYGSQEGSIRQIQAAECLRAMTQERALELEQAMKFD